MKPLGILTILTIFIIISSCKVNDNSKSNNSNSYQQESAKNIDKLILTEKKLGTLRLKKGMPLEALKIKEFFNDFVVTKNVGTQDGPDYIYYKIGNEALLKTPNKEENILSQLVIIQGSNIVDEYGIKLGMTYDELKNNRPNMHISTEHHHIYLYQENSNIAYEMSIGNYNGPDKPEYSLDEIKNYNSKVISIIWK